MKYLDLKDRKIIMIGFGSIGPAVLPLILRHITTAPSHIVVIAADSQNKHLADAVGVKFIEFELSETNYQSFLTPLMQACDILLNLSVGISSLDLIRLCQPLNVLYLDTSNEVWATDSRLERATTLERRIWATNYAKEQPVHAPTALICHGVNPGLVSHFAKKAVVDVFLSKEQNLPELNTASDWGHLAKRAGVVTMHVSEKDTQYSKVRRSHDEHVNTWSVEGFLEEAAEYTGIGWGTHERELPDEEIRAKLYTENYRAIELLARAHAVKLNSWIPSFGVIEGFAIPHAEAFSLAQYFSYRNDATSTFYQPTVHYVYSPCQDAQDSMHAAARHQWAHAPKHRLLFDDIVDGTDELGLLVLRKDTHDIYWYGSKLDVNEARRLAPNNNATSLQVAAGVLGGLIWIIENPHQGLVEAEQADYKRILDIAAPYLGQLGGVWSTWHFAANEAAPYWHFADLRVNEAALQTQDA
jgi:homospermidine synthase